MQLGKTKAAKLASGFVGVAMAISFALGGAVVPAQAQNVSDLQAQIASLLAQIATLQSQLQTVGGTTGGVSYTFTRNLSQGATGEDVKMLQKVLNQSADTQIAASGAGSPGNESTYFGALTKAAVVKFQNKYAAEILAPAGLTAGTGFVGAGTRAKLNSMSGGVVGTTPGTTVPTGAGLFIASASQPAASLAPDGASRVPFTRFTLTNNSGAAVTINSVTVERRGPANDAVFSGVVLLNQDGTIQYGNSKTFNSNHQAAIGDPVTLNNGESRTFTVGGNMASDNNSYDGQVATIAVVGVNTSTTVNGSLPVVGTGQTINASLVIGTLPMAVASDDPDTTALNSATAGKEIGTTNYTIAAVRATAGAAEDVWVKTVRWNQAGSASAGDLANVKMVVDGVDYPMTIDSTGKYYNVVFPGMGLEIQKGLQKTFAVKVDIIGGPNRTVRFDLYKATDFYVVGETYGHGITPSQSENGTVGDGSEFTTGTPFFSGTVVQVNAGTVSSVSRANEVPAQNVAENTPNQVLGGFVVDIKGEGIMIQQQIFTFDVNSSAANAADLTNVTLVDENGAVVAGPVDGSTSTGGVTFTDTVTYPTGRHVYTLKGKYGTDFVNGDSVQASTTPSSKWTNVTGASTGNTVSLSTLSTDVTANIMTVKTGAVALSVGSTPAAQNVVAGVTSFGVGSYNFDATQSGEDLRFNSAKFMYDETSAPDADPTNCFAFDGTTRLNNTAVNPTTDATDHTFTFDTPLVVSKGTVKNVVVKCDIPGSATSGSFAWDIQDGGDFVASFSGTGLASGETITPSTAVNAIIDGNLMTISSGGTLKVYEDSSSPSYTLAAGGTTGVTVGVLRFESTNEDLRLDRVALVMSNVAATSTPQDIQQVTLWDGGTQVGSAIFTGSIRTSTSTLTSTVVIPKDSYKLLTVKADLSAIGTGQAGESGVLVQVDYNNADSTGTRAIGQASGSTINRTSTADSSFDGVRMFKSYPTFAQLSAPSTVLVGGTDIELTRFSVKANAAGPIALNEVTINVATSSASTVSGTTTVTDLKVYGYTDSSCSQPISGFTTPGLAYDGGEGVASGDNETEFTSIVTVPANSTYCFRVVADVTLNTGTGNFSGYIDTKVAGDSAYMDAINVLMTDEAAADGTNTNDQVVWSPISTTTADLDNNDWTNGYGIPGLPSTGLSGTRLSK